MKLSQRALQKERTRKKIIETALTKFAQNGLFSTPTTDVAQSAGVAHGTLFAHFPTREDLISAVIQEFGSTVTRRIHQLASGEGNLNDVLEAHLKGLKEVEAFYIRLLTEEKLLPREVRNTLIGIQSAVSFHIIQTAEKEMNEGKIRVMPLHLVFNNWIALIHYYLMNSEYFAPGESVIGRYGDELIHYFLTLLRREDGGEERA